MVRDIIDIDSTYEDFEASGEEDELKINKKAKKEKMRIKILIKKMRKVQLMKMMNSMYLWLKWKRKLGQKLLIY